MCCSTNTKNQRTVLFMLILLVAGGELWTLRVSSRYWTFKITATHDTIELALLLQNASFIGRSGESHERNEATLLNETDIPAALHAKTDPATTTTIHRSGNNCTTKMIAVADFSYAVLGIQWYQKMQALGYGDCAVLVATDLKAAEIFSQEQQQKQTNLQWDTVLPLSRMNDTTCLGVFPTQRGKRPQQYRQWIFGTRWLYILEQLKAGFSVFSTDVDNIFSKFVPLSTLEESDSDVIHAYCGYFPIRAWDQLGFTVCGGLVWLRSCPGTIRFVEALLKRCGGLLSHKNFACGASCDDQVKINNILIRNLLNVTWNDGQRDWTAADIRKSPAVQGYFKESITGVSHVTGHRIAIWNVDTAYRGPTSGVFNADTNRTRCPVDNWIAAPTFDQTSSRTLKASKLRSDKITEWSQTCGNISSSRSLPLLQRH